MKKKIASLLFIGVLGISSLFACPHTYDGSDCADCAYSKCVKEKSVAGASLGFMAGVGAAAATYGATGLGCIAATTAAGAALGAEYGRIVCPNSSDNSSDYDTSTYDTSTYDTSTYVDAEDLE